MALTLTLVQTRPNTDVAFHNASDDFKALKQEMVDAGTLVDNGGGNDEAGLKRTWTITFPHNHPTDENNYTNFENDARAQSYMAEREAYNLGNGITEQISFS